MKQLLRALLGLWVIGYVVISCAPLLTTGTDTPGATTVGVIASAITGAALFAPWIVGVIVLGVLYWIAPTGALPRITIASREGRVLLAGASVLLIVLIYAIQSAPGVPSAPSASSTPMPTATAPFTASPLVTASLPTYRPTPAPAARMKIGKLDYDRAVCWAQGGFRIDHSLVVKNQGEIPSESFTLGTIITDSFATYPLMAADNWDAEHVHAANSKSAGLLAPEIAPGKTVTLRWHTWFDTPFDLDYVLFVEGPWPGMSARWPIHIAVTIC